ncbi:MAG TPA: preprotein translocase subunit YajC, partial [Thiothrix sp.]|nr:preprotein translocase subunit YajC [Thiothrix sp.]
MDFFISNAMASDAAPQGGGLELLIMVGIFFAIMYFMIIRPQAKRAKEHKNLL